jgi:hypothetical protein
MMRARGFPPSLKGWEKEGKRGTEGTAPQINTQRKQKAPKKIMLGQKLGKKAWTT